MDDNTMQGSNRPTLGVMPAFVVIDSRIEELSDAIQRKAREDVDPGKYAAIADYAVEILGHCNTMRRGREENRRWQASENTRNG